MISSGRGAAPLVSVIAASAEAAGIEESAGVELVAVEDAGADAMEALAGGLERACGELVVHLPPGDSLLPGAIGQLRAALAARPAVVLVYPAFHRVDPQDGGIEAVIPEELDPVEMFKFQYSPVGPGAIFRRQAALEALRLDLGSPFAEFAFWLRLAAKGEVRRLIEPLARRRVDARPPRQGGVEVARERLVVYEQLLSELELSPASEASARVAARSACVLAALEFGPGFEAAGERFFIVDRFSESRPDDAGDPDAEIARLEAHKVNLEQRIARQRAVIPALEATVATRENRLENGDRGASLSRRLLGRLRGGVDG
jgi:hypothetical protein